MDNVLTFTDSNFNEEVLQSDTLVLVDFWAEWCGPCHMLTPTIKELATELEGKVKIGKLNVDDDQATAARYGIRSIPTIMLFKDGKEVNRLIGVQPKGFILQSINEHLKDKVAV